MCVGGGGEGGFCKITLGWERKGGGGNGYFGEGGERGKKGKESLD